MTRKLSPVEVEESFYQENQHRVGTSRIVCNPSPIPPTQVVEGYSALRDLYSVLGDDVSLMVHEDLVTDVMVGPDLPGNYVDEPAEHAINAGVEEPIGENPVHRIRPLSPSRMSLSARLRHDPAFASHMQEQALLDRGYGGKGKKS